MVVLRLLRQYQIPVQNSSSEAIIRTNIVLLSETISNENITFIDEYASNSTESKYKVKIISTRRNERASLVAQWLRICLPMQGTQVWALVWEDDVKYILSLFLYNVCGLGQGSLFLYLDVQLFQHHLSKVLFFFHLQLWPYLCESISRIYSI